VLFIKHQNSISQMARGPFSLHSLHTQIKSNRQGRVSLASAKPDHPSGARRGEPPLRQNFPRKSFLPKRLLCFPTISITESWKPVRAHISGKVDRAEGLLRLQDTDTSLDIFRKKVTLARINDSATDEQVRILKTRGKETKLYNTTIRCLGLGGREKHMHTPNKLLRQN
jgi:hypothetical protein